jgi:hypothetical protein
MGSSSKPSMSTDNLGKPSANERLCSFPASSVMNDADIVHKALSLYEELREASDAGRKHLSPKA